MKKHFVCCCLAVVMALMPLPSALAVGVRGVSATSIRADLPDPIMERLLEGESKYLPPFDFLNDLKVKYAIRESVQQLLVQNSSVNPQFPENFIMPTEEVQDEDLNPFAEIGKVVKVEFDTGDPGVTAEPSFKWFVVGATYGLLPAFTGSSEFSGWFTALDGGDPVTPDSLVTTSMTKLYAHWKSNNVTAGNDEAKSGETEDGALRFSDVAENSPFYDSIYWAVKNRITKGIEPGHFSPSAKCTRKQIIMFLWRSEVQPSDADSNDFDAAIAWAYETGILSQEDSEFDKEAPCTRAEAMEYLWKKYGQPKLEDEAVRSTLATFDDISEIECIPAIAWALKNNITKGTTSNTFNPDTICTRGQIVTFLYRAHTVAD